MYFLKAYVGNLNLMVILTFCLNPNFHTQLSTWNPLFTSLLDPITAIQDEAPFTHYTIQVLLIYLHKQIVVVQ